MKQVHVLHTFANNDGVPYITWFMKRAAQEHNVRYSFLLLCAQKPKMLEEIRSYGFQGKWIYFDPARRKRGMMAALPRMWWQMMRWRPDIVHGHLFDDTLPAMVAARLAGIKARFITRQDSGFHLFYAPKWVFLDRLATKLATRVVAVSGDTRQLMVQHEKAPPAKIGIVHHGIDPAPYLADHTAEAAALKQRFGLGDAYPLVGTVARLIEWKGHRHIIEAARLLVKDHPRIHFIFCGTGDQEGTLRQLVEEAGLQKHITFTGWMDRNSIPALYSILDIYLHAADHEPFGFVLAEAMMSGTPVVSTRTGGVADVAEDGRSVIFAEERSGRALAHAVQRALDAGPHAIGREGRKLALLSFTFDRMWDGYMVEYSKALAPAPR
ncbi:MAG: glycosyltransferase family 4 protein [Bacteroidetes bacterium]|nr:glycosyltransferase family 4 protein [Bacteroidota bacterium]MBS1942905.1 glycosyltransferase family 4 protein [Bacteroidota bacterium]